MKITRQASDRIAKVAILPTCLVDAVCPEVGVACVRVLRRAGLDVSVVADATCCGQPAWNAGEVRAAAAVARTTLRAVADVDADAVVVPSGSCATMMRVFWPELFEEDGDHRSAELARSVAARVHEFSEFADEHAHAPPTTTSDPPADPIVYHHSCHMLRELRIKEQPERLLDAAGARRVPSDADNRCCGFGGLFSVKLPETSSAMADDVLDAATGAGAATVVGCDSSCLMHLKGRAERRGLPLAFRHLAEELDRAGSPGRQST